MIHCSAQRRSYSSFDIGSIHFCISVLLVSTFKQWEILLVLNYCLQLLIPLRHLTEFFGYYIWLLTVCIWYTNLWITLNTTWTTCSVTKKVLFAIEYACVLSRHGRYRKLSPDTISDIYGLTRYATNTNTLLWILRYFKS